MQRNPSDPGRLIGRLDAVFFETQAECVVEPADSFRIAGAKYEAVYFIGRAPYHGRNDCLPRLGFCRAV